MIILQPGFSIAMDDRKRLSRISAEEHTAQSQAMTGIPWDVPVPRKVIFILYFELAQIYILLTQQLILCHTTARLLLKC